MHYLSEIISFLAGAIAGGVAVKVSTRISKGNTSIGGQGNLTDSYNVTQRDIAAGGDVVGRDKTGK